MATIYKNENAVILRDLLDDDGNPILISSLSFLKVQLIQYNRVIVTYTLLPTPADPEIEASTTSQVKVQLTEAVSVKLKEGDLFVRLLMKQTDSDYSVDTSLYDIDQSECFEVIL